MSAHLKQFLRENVAEYLIADLRTMLLIAPKPWDVGGGLGYPLISTTCAGIELLGGLTQGPDDGRKSFVRYWERFLYSPTHRAHGAAESVYTAARNGIAHVFLPKGSLSIAFKKPQYHFIRDREGRAYIDAHAFAEDFIESYEHRFLPFVMEGEAAQFAETRLRTDAARSARVKLEVGFESSSLPPLQRSGGMGEGSEGASGFNRTHIAESASASSASIIFPPTES